MPRLLLVDRGLQRRPATDARGERADAGGSHGIAKYAVELDLRAAHEMFGLNYVVFRPHNVYGEFQNTGDPYRSVIGIFMNRLLQGEPMPVFGDGTQTRAFTYVGAIIPAMARSPEVPAALREVFNVGAETTHAVGMLAHAVAAAMGVVPELLHLPERREVKHAYSDHGKAHRVFGAPTDTPLAEGLARMAAWVRTVGARRSRPFEGIELTRSLPESWRPAVSAATDS